MEANEPKTGGIVLAAGASSRLGRAKQLLEYKGERLIDRMVGLFSKLPLDECCVVYGARRAEMEPVITQLSVATAYNPDWSTGMAGSLQTGLKTLLELDANLSAILIALVDQPLLTITHFSAMLELHRVNPNSIIAAAYEDTQGVPAIFPSTFFPELLSQKVAVGAKKIIKKYADQVISYSCPEAAFDIDTEADYQRLLSL
jgi:molybdenum cofactor cytidylyltransferase